MLYPIPLFILHKKFTKNIHYNGQLRSGIIKYYTKFLLQSPLFSTESPVKTTEIDFDLYTEKKLSDTFRLYWRILKEHKELEAIMVVNGTSYAALGWRPRGLTKSCKNFPQIGPVASEGSSNGSAEPEPNSEPKSEPEPSSEPEPNAEPKSEPEPEPKSEPEASSEPEPNPESDSASKKSLYSRRSASPTPAIQTAPPHADVVETSVSFQVSKKQGICSYLTKGVFLTQTWFSLQVEAEGKLKV